MTITHRHRGPVRALLLLIGLLLSGAPAAAVDQGETPARFPPLGTEVWVPDRDLFTTTQAPEGDAYLQRYRGLPSGPAVDTPSRPIAPAVALHPAEPLEPPPIHHLEVMLDWFPSPRHAALLIALEQGLFARRGLAVTLTTPADPDVPTKLLAASRIDLALTRQPLLHLQVDRGLPLVRVATLVGVPLTGLVARADAGIASPADLAGKRIGHVDLDGEAVLLAALLRRHAIAREELDSPDVHYRPGQALHDGRVDAVIGAMRHLLPRRLADEGLATRTFAVEEHGMPLHDGLILVANRSHLHRQRAAIARLVDALEEATAWLLAHPDEAWPLLVAIEPALDTPTNRAAWPEIRARLTQTPAALHRARYAELERFLLEAGMIETRTPVARLAIDPNAAERAP